MEKERKAAIVLAAGQGKRMQTDRPKQYLLLKDKPVLYYSLQTFQNSEIDEIILVTGAGEEVYCQQEIVHKYNFSKVKQIVAGGRERYHSVFEGLKALKAAEMPDNGYVFIQDGARPFLTPELIHKLLEETRIYGACVAGMPVKDTIKLVDEEKNVVSTPARELVWQIQTPQVFSYRLVYQAYQKLFQKEKIQVTDDAMVVEQMTGHQIHLVEASYRNIKITTPEDIRIAEAFLR
ncbi:2-C-methyl-D-erythritol 4-phosphate cytidylyltransferase [Acetivibrio ethanolgignens]|uniref:2-C-methyl-D-erythritol 4-phosphate cytidylyltransferase n=1 Tax=Acetivibrio ethanolgignens TaxID=290052 RepID=A0A0V8QDC5_9FIRM|nr:2-C-methyl-D-erythritol 4-phosphate cytidylyltransferase [Acetivibrio ethanolgignens]KSV58587.1 2-C-methyl-D-erythritol 4-phosphate cytidylyltransferase [Acetivibrio ethanolgignens]